MKTICSGTYSLRKIDEKRKLLTLDKKSYIWASSNPDYLIRCAKNDSLPPVISKGKFWMFDVLSRTNLTKGLHLSIVKTPGEWEAFVMPDGLPNKRQPQISIFPTEERIACPNKNTRQKTGIIGGSH